MHSKDDARVSGGNHEAESRRIVSGLRQNRPDALATVTRWAASVARHAAWGFESPEDIVQETLLALLRNLESERFIGGDLRAYVRRIAKNLCVSSYRKSRVRGIVVELADNVPSTPSGERRDEVENGIMVQTILQELEKPCREIITLAYLHGLTRKEIAIRYGITEGAAKVRLFRCLEKARTIQQAFGGSDVH